ncbi:MAG TPA: archaetidylserine decarboxylase [Nevskiaceae bacterium]|nr:archaetidylserine decarboxylase [Nevskiaceae bacterium]
MTQHADTDASPRDLIFAAFQRILPTRFLSWCIYRLTRIESPGFKNALIKYFLRGFTIDMTQAQVSDPYAYKSFNEFFTRPLKDGARQLAPEPAFVSPVDGTVSRIGRIESGRLIQAKGHNYSATDLIGGGMDDVVPLLGGNYCTIYLAPYNYHRIHMPVAGALRWWRYVPGRLFSVNPSTARALPGLFTRNERVIAMFDTERGPLAMVLVGALFVGGIETVWSGAVTPPHMRYEDKGSYMPLPKNGVRLARGQEMGRFNMGSTVILLTGQRSVNWATAVQAGSEVRMGQELGR